MCLFPRPNFDFSGNAYQHGVYEFACGTCPECLHKKSSYWILKGVFEARERERRGERSCMITLTYDDYLRADNGSLIYRNGEPVEKPVNTDLVVCKRHVQLFIKRLRKHFKNQNIKYIASAEYGKRTHRAHYHLILFGVNFDDAVLYKRSKRGNKIKTSSTLRKLWKFGISTVDSDVVTSSNIAYCTKYTMKDKGNDTFMLFSHDIGTFELLRSFTGRPYMIEGRSYPIPRKVWELYISYKYPNSTIPFDFRYISKSDPRHRYQVEARANYRFVRDNDPVYQQYLKHWQDVQAELEFSRPTVYERILKLPEGQYHCYKVRALSSLRDRLNKIVGYSLDPRASERTISTREYRVADYYYQKFHIDFYAKCENLALDKWYRECRARHLPYSSRHNTANDTFLTEQLKIEDLALKNIILKE